MLERYLIFTCCSAKASISASTRKRKNFDSCASALAFHGKRRIIVFALDLSSPVKTSFKCCEEICHEDMKVQKKSSFIRHCSTGSLNSQH